MFFNNCIEQNQSKTHFEGRLEFSQKFILFGAAILPLVCPDPSLTLSELTRVVFETRPICFQSKGLLLFAFDMSSPLMGIMMTMMIFRPFVYINNVCVCVRGDLIIDEKDCICPKTSPRTPPHSQRDIKITYLFLFLPSDP